MEKVSFAIPSAECPLSPCTPCQGQGGCERRIEVFVKIQKKNLGGGGGGGLGGVGGWDWWGGSGWM